MFAALNSALPLVFAATEAGGDEGLNPIVAPNTGVMIWTLIAFIVAFLILRKFAFPKIGEFLDERANAIQTSMDHAESTRREADELLAEYRERLREARAQADDITLRARKAAEHAEQEALEAGRAKREELLERARADIQAETRRALQDIRAEVASLTVQATEAVTRKTLTEDDQRRLVDEALSELDFSALSGERR